MASLVNCTNDMQKLCTGIMISYALLISEIRMEHHIEEIIIILRAFFIPVTQFMECYRFIKNLLPEFRYSWLFRLVVITYVFLGLTGFLSKQFT